MLAGVLVAIGPFFWANRLLPEDEGQHGVLELYAFFGAWAIAALHAFARPAAAATIGARRLAVLARKEAAGLPIDPD